MILVVGLDAYAWEWRSYLEMAGYQVAKLHSPYAMSGPAWNSIFTGLCAETHGYAGQPDAEGKPVLPKQPPYLWDHLTARGKESVVVNTPFIWPPSLCRLHVCGYPAPAKGYVFPRSLEEEWPHDELDLVNYDAVTNKQQWPEQDIAALLERTRYCRWSLAHRLRLELAKGKPPLTAFCLTDLDRLGHLCGEALQESLPEIIHDILLLVEQIAGHCGARWTILVSDHGLDLCSKHESSGRSFAHGRGQLGTEYGVFAYRGPDTQPFPAEEMQVEDVTPTLLWLLDMPPVFPLEGRAYREINSSKDEVETRRKLEALGYV